MDLPNGVEQMENVVANLRKELGKIRVGRAKPDVLDAVMVEAYESKMPVSHMATITVPDARTITIQPWDDTNVKAIEKAIMGSDIGLTPVVDGKIIRLSVPALTTELREEYIREMKDKVESARVAVRGIRHKIMGGIDDGVEEGGVSEDDIKRQKDEVEKEVKKISDSIDELAEEKENELRTI